jgi:hypothetical protein
VLKIASSGHSKRITKGFLSLKIYESKQDLPLFFLTKKQHPNILKTIIAHFQRFVCFLLSLQIHIHLDILSLYIGFYSSITMLSSASSISATQGQLKCHSHNRKCSFQVHTFSLSRIFVWYGLISIYISVDSTHYGDMAANCAA